MTASSRSARLTKRFAGIVALDEREHRPRARRAGRAHRPERRRQDDVLQLHARRAAADAGTVELDGKDITGLSVSKRARLGIGRTFQRIELFPDATVRDHLFIAERVRRGGGSLWRDLFGHGPCRVPDEIARCDEVLELLRLKHLADEPIERLSLGQCRLVEVGRALMTEPKVLLLDEPSSGLDRAESAALAQTLQEVQAEQGFAILLVEHDVELVSTFTTRSYVLDFGRMIAEGPSLEVLRSPEVRAAYLGDLEPTG